jgi:hypothetical protein
MTDSINTQGDGNGADFVQRDVGDVPSCPLHQNLNRSRTNPVFPS